MPVPIPPFFVGVFSQPKGSFAKWKARGINVLIGSEPEKRADGTPSVSQADWRSAARAAGLPYYDRPSNDPAADAADEWLLGFLMDDEPDRRIVLPAINALKTEKDPERRAALQKTIDDYVAAYKAAADRCRATGKPVLGNFSGPEITGGFPWYQGVGQLPFLPLVTEEGADWYVVNSKNPPYPANLIGQQLQLLASWRSKAGLPRVPQWCFLECGNMRKGSGGRGPTDAELADEVTQAKAAGVKGIIWFPQAFSPFTYDNLTPAEAMRLQTISLGLAGGQAPVPDAPPPPPVVVPPVVPPAVDLSAYIKREDVQAMVAQLAKDFDAKLAPLVDASNAQAKLSTQILNKLQAVGAVLGGGVPVP